MVAFSLYCSFLAILVLIVTIRMAVLMTIMMNTFLGASQIMKLV